MGKNQLELLTSLANEIKSKKKNKKKIVATLTSAKILTLEGHFTSQYSNLKRVVISE